MATIKTAILPAFILMFVLPAAARRALGHPRVALSTNLPQARAYRRAILTSHNRATPRASRRASQPRRLAAVWQEL